MTSAIALALLLLAGLLFMAAGRLLGRAEDGGSILTVLALFLLFCGWWLA